MSTSRTIDNLNIRKFSNKAAFDSATIGEDDICVLLDDGTPLMYTTALPEPSASVENAVYYLISDYQGQTGWYQGQRIYKCYFDGSIYYWSMLNTQQNLNYGSRYSDTLNVSNTRTAFRFAYSSSLPLGGFIVQMSDGFGSDFVAVIVGEGGVYRQTTLKATGAFEGIRLGTYKTSTTATTRYYALTKKDNSTFFNSSTRVTYTVIGLGNDADTYQYGRITAVTINSTAAQTRTWFEEISGSQTTDMLEVTPDNLGQTRQYTGATDSTYTNGYFYKATGTEVVTPAVMATTIISPSGEATVSIDATSFITNFCSWAGWSAADLERSLTDSAQQTWVINYSIDNTQVVEVYAPFFGWIGATSILQCFSVTYTGSLSSGNTDINFTVAYTPSERTVQDGAWERVDVQPAPVVPDPLPSQTGNAGKFLTTDGTSASWSDKPITNEGTGTSAIGIGGTATGTRSIGIGGNAMAPGSIAIGGAAGVSGGNYNGSIAIGRRAAVNAAHAIQISAAESPTQSNSDANTFKVANQNGNYEIMSADGTIPADRLTHAINKYSTMPTASASNEGWIVQYTGATDATYTHGYIYECAASPATATCEQTYGSGLTDISVTNTSTFEATFCSAFSVSAMSGTTVVDFEYDGSAWMVSAEIEGQTESVFDQNITDWAITFTGTPQAGDTITVTHTAGGYAWTQTDVQPSSGGSSYTAGSGISIDANNEISVTAPTLVNTATGTDSLAIGGTNTGVYSVSVGIGSGAQRESVVIGYNGSGLNGYVTCVGCNASSNSWFGIALGYNARAYAQHAIQIGTYGNGYTVTNSDANTFKVANANGNYEIMSADGTIPEARLADTTSATQGQVLTLDSNLNAVWANAGGGGGSVPTLTWYTVSTAGNTLTIADTSSAQLVKIYKNGLLLQPTEDYTISGTTLTTVGALVVGDKITTEVF